jgi:ABC-type Fe3+-hydroxamate transport system substrate-binding protein
MQNSTLLGIIISALLIASFSTSIGIAFAQTPSMNNNTNSVPRATSNAQNATTTPTTGNQTSTNLLTADQPRIINHSMGTTEITGTPERIVALDWSASENLLTMGIPFIAVADLEGMKKYLRPEGLSPEIVDVGAIEQPNLEVILQLEPDLIFAVKYSHEGIYEELSSIAPTVMYDNAPPLDGSPTHLEALEQNIIMVADAAGMRDRGVELVERLHAKYDEAAQKIAAAGLNGTKFVAAAADPPYGEYTTSTLRLFDNTFFTSQLLSQIGLVNAVTEEYGLANWGLKEVGLEGLATVDGPDIHLFYIHADGQDPFEGEWKDNPVWTNLEIAKSGNVHPLGTSYVYGGVEEMEGLVDKVVAALTSTRGNQ